MKIIEQLGPYGIKFIQTMRPKEINSWIAKVIAKAQTDLPAPSIQTFESMLRDAFKAQGSLEYAEHFSSFFEVKKILGAGTVGIAALIEVKSLNPEDKKPNELVVKIIRPGSLEAFLKDHQCFSQAAERLLIENLITPQEAQSFKEFIREMFNRALQELNPNLENTYLAQSPYQQEFVCTTVKGNLELAGKARDVVFMEKASGIELGKYLQTINKSLSNAVNEEKRKHLEQIAKLRKLYAQLALLHFKRQGFNESVHIDLHPGNLFYNEETNMFSILDLGSMAHPLDPADESLF